MTDIENEEIINYLVVCNKPGRVYTTESDNHWGGLIQPAPDENPDKIDSGLRVVLFVSWDFGYLMIEALKEFENKFGGQFNIVGLVTDNPLNPNAKISLKKRVWSHNKMFRRTIDETFIIESALSDGVPVYTGEVKTEYFRGILEEWNADAIIVCVFGQLIDSFIINYPGYGIYNFQPSDLSQNYGAGPAPYDDLAERGAETSVWTVHKVSEEIDCGKPVGKSPPVNVLDENGKIPEDPIVVYHKLAEVLGPMAFFLAKELCGKFKLNKSEQVDSIDFESLIPDEIKERIKLPCGEDSWPYLLSIPENFLFKLG